MAALPVPKPKTVTEVCTVCDLSWDQHGKSPTLADCIRLLKAELARRSFNTWNGTTIGGSGISFIPYKQGQVS